jgi:hypothetical protein
VEAVTVLYQDSLLVIPELWYLVINDVPVAKAFLYEETLYLRNIKEGGKYEIQHQGLSLYKILESIHKLRKEMQDDKNKCKHGWNKQSANQRMESDVSKSARSMRNKGSSNSRVHGKSNES